MSPARGQRSLQLSPALSPVLCSHDHLAGGGGDRREDREAFLEEVVPKPLVWAFPSASRKRLEGGTQGQATARRLALAPEREPWEPQNSSPYQTPTSDP